MIGEVIGSYKLVARLGQGGMGVVYVAEHSLIGSRAVVKMLLPEASAQKELVERFFNEAKAATSVKHPGIVQIFDFGFHASGSAYIAMELLEGETLATRIKSQRIALGSAVTIARQVASALDAAHRAGIVHRDLKPDNIFLVADPELPEGERAKILDFGIAKLAMSQSTALTRTGEVFGTPLYMSPEQCRNAAAVDPRTDIYALGCILYEMVTSRPPFNGAGVAQLVSAHMFEQPKPPSQLASVPPTLEKVILRALSKSPSERHRSMLDLASDLEEVGRLTSAPTISPPRSPKPSQSDAGPISTTIGLSSGQLGLSRNRPRRAVAIVTVVGATGAGFAAWGYHRQQRSRPIALGSEVRSTTENAASPTPPAPPDAASANPPRDSELVVSGAPPAEEVVRTRMSMMLASFLRWSADRHDHACPRPSDLAAVTHNVEGVKDPWGHAMIVTCVRQPADQMIGVISAGPDGLLGTSDDILSWQYSTLADLVRGARWQPRQSAVTSNSVPRPSLLRPKDDQRPQTAAKPPPLSDAVQMQTGSASKPRTDLKFDENGMPIER